MSDIKRNYEEEIARLEWKTIMLEEKIEELTRIINEDLPEIKYRITQLTTI